MNCYSDCPVQDLRWSDMSFNVAETVEDLSLLLLTADSRCHDLCCSIVWYRHHAGWQKHHLRPISHLLLVYAYQIDLIPERP